MSDAVDKLVDWQMTDSPAARRERGERGQSTTAVVMVMPADLMWPAALRALDAINAILELPKRLTSCPRLRRPQRSS